VTAPYTADSYQGIIDAFNTLRAAQGERKYSYTANFQGIIEAILDLKKWGQAGDGDFPPGWVPEYDEDGNIIGGNWNPPPDNGTLWFDERQGRLFVWVDDDFYQTNGGDGLPHVGANPPTSEVPGSFWFNTSTNVLYIYDGQSWTIVSTAAGVSTETLTLTNTTRALVPSVISTQAGMNGWVAQALKNLEDEIEEKAGEYQVYMADVPPSESQEGDLWYNTNKLQMLVRYDDAWVASAIPVVLDDSFVALTNTVEANRLTSVQAVNNVIALVEQVANRPERVFGLGYDTNEEGIQLTDSKGDSHLVKFQGQNGISIDVTHDGIKVDASAISNALNALEQTVASGDNVAVIADRLSTVEGNVGTLLNAPTVSPTAFQDLSNAVSQLPSFDDVSGRLSLLGGTMQGPLTMTSQRILDVGQPVNNNDAARKVDVDNLKAYADGEFLSKSLGAIGHLAISKTDVARPVFDFSANPSNGQQALKLRTYGGTGNFTTFGTNENPWEYAWNFESNEDFCWVHETNGKQVSINKDGLTAKKLTLGTFLPNSDSGTVVMNKIDVGESLAKHKEALQTIKAALIVSTSFEEFKLEVLQTLNTI
jgi:hypothetical protein